MIGNYRYYFNVVTTYSYKNEYRFEKKTRNSRTTPCGSLEY